MTFRDAAHGDAIAISAVHRAAFGGADEANLVEALTADGDALVSLIASIEGATVGHVMFSGMRIEADGAALAGAGLAPVGVHPHYQRIGLGAALIREGVTRLRALGIQIVFILGDPAYYSRFGFSADCAAPFASPYAGPHLMALYLDSAVIAPQSGRADYAPAFARLGAG